MGKKNRKKREDREERAAPVADSKSPKPAAKSGLPKLLIPIAVIAIAAVVIIALMNREADEITLDWEVLADFKHESVKTYTQGLEFYKGFLFEGTGFEKESDWRIVNLQTGEVCYRYGISSALFGEGITIIGDHLYQVTWRDHKAFKYDLSGLKLDELDSMTATKESFEGRHAKKVKEFTYKGEGWGLTNDGTHIIMSTGNADGKIYFRNPETFEVEKTIVVTDADGKPQKHLNELEYHDGSIWANIYTTNFVVKIDAASGEITDKADLTGLLPEGTKLKDGEVLNGIARDPLSGRLYFTGKNWPKLFDVKFTKKQD